MNDTNLDVALFRGETAAELIPVDMIEPWEHNPRRTMDHNAIAELAASIGKVGVLQPILVRPIRNGAMFGIVSGERRWRAAKYAGQGRIPAVVRTLTDAEALEIAVTENLQREDVPPLEEAEGYARLQSQHGYTVEEIADKVGKSKTYVYARLKLTALCEEARELVRQHNLTPTVALLIARIPTPSHQVEAAKACAAGGDGQPLSATVAARLIRNRYMLRLADATFPTSVAGLVPAAGACTDCPKRTGNQPELFGDIQEADTCTDSVCFEGKTARWFEMRAERHEADGGKVVRADSAARYGWWREEYVTETEICPHDNAQRPWGEVVALAKKPPAPVLLQLHADTPEWIRAWPRKVANKVAEKLGIEPKAAREEGEGEDEAGGGEEGPSKAVPWHVIRQEQRAWHLGAVAKLIGHDHGWFGTLEEWQAMLFIALRWMVYDDRDEALGLSLQFQEFGLNILSEHDENMVEEDDVLAERIKQMKNLDLVRSAVRLCVLSNELARDWLPAIADERNIDIGAMPHAEQS